MNTLIKKNNNFLNNFSKHLFWDVDISALDEEKHLKYIITQVLEYGLYQDWLNLVDHFKLGTIVDSAIGIKGLDKRAASFLATISGQPRNKFLCYTTEQSIPKHWNF